MYNFHERGLIMSRIIGTTAMGLRAPIIKTGDDLVEIVTNMVKEVSKEVKFHDRDVICLLYTSPSPRD